MAAISVTTANTNSLLNSASSVFRDSKGTPYVLSFQGTFLQISTKHASKNLSAFTSDLYTGLDKGVAQTFIGSGNSIVSFGLNCNKVGSPTGDLYLKVYAVSGTVGSTAIPTGTALYSQTFDVSTMPSALGDFEFELSTPFSTTNGTGYAISLEYSGGNSSNYFRARQSYPSLYSGNAAEKNSTDVWESLGAMISLGFYINEDAVSFTQYTSLTGGTLIQGVSGAIDSTDIIHICWMDDAGAASKLKYFTFDCNTFTFSTITTITADIGGDPGAIDLHTSIQVDSNNKPHIVYTEYPSIMGAGTYVAMYTNKVGAAWITAIQVRYVSGVQCTRLHIIIDMDNLPLIKAEATSSSTSFYKGNLNNATSFTEYNDTLGYHRSSFVIDNSGNQWVIGQNSSSKLVARKHIYTNSWATWETIIESSYTVAIGKGLVTSVIVGSDIYAFYEENNSNDICYAKLNGTSWETAVVLETGTFNLPIVKWGFWVNNDSSGSLMSQNNQIVHFTNSSWSAIYGEGTANNYEKQGVLITTNSRGGKYNNIRLAVDKVGSPTDNLIVKVYSGSWTDTLIATSNTVSGASLTTTSQFVDFVFASNFTLAGSTTYYIVIERTGTYDVSNSYHINGGSSSQLNTNNVRYRQDNNSFVAVTGYDTMIYFGQTAPEEIDYVFMDETATPDVWWNNLSFALPTFWVTKLLKWYNGASWVEKPLKYHNGSTWVTKPVKINM